MGCASSASSSVEQPSPPPLAFDRTLTAADSTGGGPLVGINTIAADVQTSAHASRRMMMESAHRHESLDRSAEFVPFIRSRHTTASAAQTVGEQQPRPRPPSDAATKKPTLQYETVTIAGKFESLPALVRPRTIPIVGTPLQGSSPRHALAKPAQRLPAGSRDIAKPHP